MTRVSAAQSVLARLATSAIAPKGEAARASDETDRNEDEEKEFRRHVQRKNGRGIMVDKTI